MLSGRDAYGLLFQIVFFLLLFLPLFFFSFSQFVSLRFVFISSSILIKQTALRIDCVHFVILFSRHYLIKDVKDFDEISQ